MRSLLILLSPILLIGCNEPERDAHGIEADANPSAIQPDWKTREIERKARVQELLAQITDESAENRDATFAELRDEIVRKRDVPELNLAIERSINSEVYDLLWDLGFKLEYDDFWRLPDNTWTNNAFEAAIQWRKELDDFETVAHLSYGEDGLRLSLHNHSEYHSEFINLILDLEPDGLWFEGGLRDPISEDSFLGTLGGLRRLSLSETKVTGLPPLKGMHNLGRLDLENTRLTDLTPLKGLPNLVVLTLARTPVADLAPLAEIPNLSFLDLAHTQVTDLTPLQSIPTLSYLDLRHTGVTDLTPLRRLENLKDLYLSHTKVTDLTPLEGMSNLKQLYIQGTNVTDLSPLEGLINLKRLKLDDTTAAEPTPPTDPDHTH